MNRDHRRSQRLAAGLFLALVAPLAITVTAAGGLLALVPLLALLVPVLLLGRHPGLEAIERLRGGGARARPRRATSFTGRAAEHPRASLLIASALSKRGPPLAQTA